MHSFFYPIFSSPLQFLILNKTTIIFSLSYLFIFLFTIWFKSNNGIYTNDRKRENNHILLIYSFFLLDIFYATKIILSCSHDACGIFYWNVLGQQYWRFKLVRLINWYLFWLKANHCSILWWTNHQQIKKCHYFHLALGILHHWR